MATNEIGMMRIPIVSLRSSLFPLHILPKFIPIVFLLLQCVNECYLDVAG
jgi:hypothetical protein